MGDGKLITAKHNEDGSSSGSELLNGQLGETRENEKASQKTPSSKAARIFEATKLQIAHLCQQDPLPTQHRKPCNYHNTALFTLHFAVIKNNFLIFTAPLSKVYLSVRLLLPTDKITLLQYKAWARGGAVGCDTALQAGRLRV